MAEAQVPQPSGEHMKRGIAVAHGRLVMPVAVFPSVACVAFAWLVLRGLVHGTHVCATPRRLAMLLGALAASPLQAKISACTRERLLQKHRFQMPDEQLVGRMGGRARYAGERVALCLIGGQRRRDTREQRREGMLKGRASRGKLALALSGASLNH